MHLKYALSIVFLTRYLLYRALDAEAISPLNSFGFFLPVKIDTAN